MAAPMQALLAVLDAIVDMVMRGRPERGAARRRAAAAAGHALSFPTWQSLTRDRGLEDREAVTLMAALVEAAGPARR